MNRDEQLSALLSGDLPEDEAVALRAELEASPDLAARYEALQALVGDLESLPDEMTPPPLEERRRLRDRLRPRSRTWGAMALIAAAAVLLLLVRGGTTSELVLVDGVQWVEGEETVRAGGMRVEVDGAAMIVVEPPGDLVRVYGQEEPEMMKSTVLGAMAGAAVTVTVYEGTALLTDEGGATEPVTVRAGETHQVGEPGTRHTRRLPTAERPAPDAPLTERERTVAELEAELAEVKQKLAEAEFTGAIAEGQLAAHVGEPADWPSPVPVGLSEAEFTASVDVVLDEHPELDVAEIDCSEYPCIAVFDVVAPVDEDVRAGLDRIGRSFEEGVDEPVGVMVGVSLADGEGGGGAVAVSLVPESTDPDVRQRAEYRFQTLMKEASPRQRQGD